MDIKYDYDLLLCGYGAICPQLGPKPLLKRISGACV